MQSSSKISVVLMFAFGDSLEDTIYCTWSESLLHSRTFTGFRNGLTATI